MQLTHHQPQQQLNIPDSDKQYEWKSLVAFIKQRTGTHTPTPASTEAAAAAAAPTTKTTQIKNQQTPQLKTNTAHTNNSSSSSQISNTIVPSLTKTTPKKQQQLKHQSNLQKEQQQQQSISQYPQQLNARIYHQQQSPPSNNRIPSPTQTSPQFAQPSKPSKQLHSQKQLQKPQQLQQQPQQQQQHIQPSLNNNLPQQQLFSQQGVKQFFQTRHTNHHHHQYQQLSQSQQQQQQLQSHSESSATPSTTPVVVESHNCSINSTSPFRTATSTYNPRAAGQGNSCLHSQTPSTTESILSNQSQNHYTKQTTTSQTPNTNTQSIFSSTAATSAATASAKGTTISQAIVIPTEKVSQFSLSPHMTTSSQSQIHSKHPSHLFSIEESIQSLTTSSKNQIQDYFNAMHRGMEEATRIEEMLESLKEDIKSSCEAQCRLVHDAFSNVEKILQTKKQTLLNDLNQQMWKGLFDVELTKNEVKFEAHKLARRFADTSPSRTELNSNNQDSKDFLEVLMQEVIDSDEKIKCMNQQLSDRLNQQLSLLSLDSNSLDADLHRLQKFIAKKVFNHTNISQNTQNNNYNFNNNNKNNEQYQSNLKHSDNEGVAQVILLKERGEKMMESGKKQDGIIVIQVSNGSPKFQKGQSQSLQGQFSASNMKHTHHVDMLNTSMSEKQATQESDEELPVMRMVAGEFEVLNRKEPRAHRSSKISNKSNVSSHKVINYSDVHDSNNWPMKNSQSQQEFQEEQQLHSQDNEIEDLMESQINETPRKQQYSQNQLQIFYDQQQESCDLENPVSSNGINNRYGNYFRQRNLLEDHEEDDDDDDVKYVGGGGGEEQEEGGIDAQQQERYMQSQQDQGEEDITFVSLHDQQSGYLKSNNSEKVHQFSKYGQSDRFKRTLLNSHASLTSSWSFKDELLRQETQFKQQQVHLKNK